MRRIQVHIVLISFLVVLVVGTAARSYFHSTRVVEPLRASIAAVPGVTQVQMAPSQNGVVQIAVARDARLAEVIPAVQTMLQSYGGQFGLEVLENPSQRGREALRRIMFVVEEAIVQGSFVAMETQVEQIAQEFDQELMLAVDRNYVYLQLRDGHGYINRVISRDNGPVVSSAALGEVSG